MQALSIIKTQKYGCGILLLAIKIYLCVCVRVRVYFASIIIPL